MKLKIEGQSICFTQRDKLVSNSVNVYTAEFMFDSAWDGYTPVAVFEYRNDKAKISRETMITDGMAVVPWETLQDPGYLRLGVYGVSADGRLPTIYTEWQFVHQGTEPAEETSEATPGVVEQVLAQTGEDRAAAERAAQKAEEAAIRQPKIDTGTMTWWQWDAELGEYVDTGIRASGGSAEKNWRLMETIDFSLAENQIYSFEWSDLDDVTELYFEGSKVENATATDSGIGLLINGVTVVEGFALNKKTGGGAYGYSYARFNGLFWDCRHSAGAISRANVRTSDVCAKHPYNMVMDVGAANTIKIITCGTNAYVPVTGTLEIWVR